MPTAPPLLPTTPRVDPLSFVRPVLLRLALIALGLLLGSPPLRATCSCSVTASPSPPLLTLSGTSGGACPANTSIFFFRDGGLVGHRFCGSTATSCSETRTDSMACLRTGEHTASALCECGGFFPGPDGQPKCADDEGFASTTFFVNSTPTVSVSVGGPDPLGNASVSTPFSFPNTLGSGSRDLTVYADGGFLYRIRPAQESGTWTEPISTACWREGEHEIRAVAVACGAWQDAAYVDEAATTVSVGTKPEVGVSVSGPDVAGRATVTVTFDFANTAGPGSRDVKVYADGGFLFAFSPAEVAGSRTKEIDTACWRQGAHEITALAVACNKASDPAYRTEATARLVVDHTPRVGVSLAPEDPTA
ncbi:MAG: hypothetical protein ACRELA_12510, partial [Candidatus Rokuibacteriota bacterium]